MPIITEGGTNTISDVLLWTQMLETSDAASSS